MTIYLLEIIANSIQNWFRKIFMLKISNCPLLSLLGVIRLNRCTLYSIDTYHFFFILFSPHQNHTYTQVLSSNVFIAIVYTLKCQTLNSFCQKVPYASFSFTCVLGSSLISLSFCLAYQRNEIPSWKSVIVSESISSGSLDCRLSGITIVLLKCAPNIWNENCPQRILFTRWFLHTAMAWTVCIDWLHRSLMSISKAFSRRMNSLNCPSMKW